MKKSIQRWQSIQVKNTGFEELKSVQPLKLFKDEQ